MYLGPVGLVDVGAFWATGPRPAAVEIDQVHVHEGVDDFGERKRFCHGRNGATEGNRIVWDRRWQEKSGRKCE